MYGQIHWKAFYILKNLFQTEKQISLFSEYVSKQQITANFYYTKILLKIQIFHALSSLNVNECKQTTIIHHNICNIIEIDINK